MTTAATKNVITLLKLRGPDKLVWRSSRDGILRLKGSYNFARPPGVVQSWYSSLWKSFIPPKCSLLTQRVLQHKVPWICIVLTCSLCDTFSVSESIDHIFVSSSIIQFMVSHKLICFLLGLQDKESVAVWFCHSIFEISVRRDFSSHLLSCKILFRIRAFWAWQRHFIYFGNSVAA